jgi:hypothetical protein
MTLTLMASKELQLLIILMMKENILKFLLLLRLNPCLSLSLLF